MGTEWQRAWPRGLLFLLIASVRVADYGSLAYGSHRHVLLATLDILGMGVLSSFAFSCITLPYSRHERKGLPPSRSACSRRSQSSRMA